MSEAAVRFKRRNLPYTQIANVALRDGRLPLAVRGFFALMLSLPDNTDHTVAYFAKVGGISKDTVYKYFGILEKNGYLTREQQHGDGGKFASNLYELTDAPCRNKPCTVLPDTEEPCTVLPDTEEPCTEKSDTKEITRRTNNNTPKAPKGAAEDDRFEKFWLFYRDTVCASDHSRAGNKAAAHKAWDRLAPDKELADALAAWLVAQLHTEMWQRGYGIPYASTLLNRVRRGEVDLTPEMAATQTRAALSQPDETREEDRWIT